MIKGKKVIAVIPARGGSKGIPNKNIKDFHGKPLIAWTIKTALESEYIDEVCVSTDSERNDNTSNRTRRARSTNVTTRTRALLLRFLC